MKPKDDKSTRTLRHHSAEEKVRLLKIHLVEGQSISAICDEHRIHPMFFCQWQKTFFENGAAVFDCSRLPPVETSPTPSQ
jgi:transposase-like protein